MGKWAMQFFGRDRLPSDCFLFPGSSDENFKERILSNFDKIIQHSYSHFERYITAKGDRVYLVIFNAYGAPAIIDLIAVLEDGGVKGVTLLGSAFGFCEELDVGDLILPSGVQAWEGILHTLENVPYSYPHREYREILKGKIDRSFRKYREGKTVSVPSVTAQPEAGLIAADALGLEMECSSFFHYASTRGIRAAALLVVSDTLKKKLVDSEGDHKVKLAELFPFLLD